MLGSEHQSAVVYVSWLIGWNFCVLSAEWYCDVYAIKVMKTLNVKDYIVTWISTCYCRWVAAIKKTNTCCIFVFLSFIFNRSTGDQPVRRCFSPRFQQGIRYHASLQSHGEGRTVGLAGQCVQLACQFFPWSQSLHAVQWPHIASARCECQHNRAGHVRGQRSWPASRDAG